jgi:predicted regulator of Ras-like GTPase activity (Roadblock/LC7/MglB family)
MTEPFTTMLTELVSGVDGAIGAAFIDNYGEAVQSFTAPGHDDEYLKLMGAYQGIALQTSQNVLKQLDAGSVDYYLAAYDNASFLVKALKANYFILLALSPEANYGQGIYRVRRVAEAFDREI